MANVNDKIPNATRSGALSKRAELLHSLQTERVYDESAGAQQDEVLVSAPQWDLIVVGGGITGAGVLREAVRYGLKVLLVEQKDFAWGTSSRSSKMVHGGLRYLAQGDFALTRHSLLERERLLREAPGLVERMGYYLALSQKKSPPALGVRAVLWLYDRIAGIRDHCRVSLSALADKFPGINAPYLKSAYYYTDAVTDDARLVQRVLQESLGSGGVALNYVQVSQLLISGGEVAGVVLQDSETHTTMIARSKVVVNATGAWADRLRNQVNSEKRVRPLRGSHIVVSQDDFPMPDAITLTHPEDHRTMFFFPWENRTVIGTTDLDHRTDLDVEASISMAEVDYLLSAANTLFPASALNRGHIISSWAGVRPIIASEQSKDPSKERRDHAVWKDGRLITVSGGKLTTFRLIAKDVLKAVSQELSLPSTLMDDPVIEPCRITAASLIAKAGSSGLSHTMAEALLGRYGDVAVSIVAMARPQELQPLEGTRFCLAECRWALREEAVLHLDDLLLRRTRLGLLLRNGGASILPRLKELCQQEVCWSEERWAREVNRYEGLWQAHYSLPLSAHKSLSEAKAAAVLS